MQTQTQRTIANNLFLQYLPKRTTIGDRAFRKIVKESIMATTGCTNSAACSAYNFSKKLYVRTGVTPDFGRSKTAVVAIAAGPNDNWKLVCKNTKNVLAFYPTRAIARKHKTQNVQVVKL